MKKCTWRSGSVPATSKPWRNSARQTALRRIRCKQYQNQGLSLPDLINEGTWADQGGTPFWRNRGFKFISYAVWWIGSRSFRLWRASRIRQVASEQVGSLSKMNKVSSGSNSGSKDRFCWWDRYGMEISEHRSKRRCGSQPVLFPWMLPRPGRWHEVSHVFVSEDARAPTKTWLGNRWQGKYSGHYPHLREGREIINLFYGIGVPHNYTSKRSATCWSYEGRVRQIKEKALRRLKHSSGANCWKLTLDNPQRISHFRPINVFLWWWSIGSFAAWKMHIPQAVGCCCVIR